MQNKDFQVGNVTLSYTNHPYNNTLVNERTVEVSLGEFYICVVWSPNPDSLIEIGAVMPYYMDDSTHKALDLFDTHPRCIKEDARKYNYTGKNVLSISTIEHIATSDYGATPGNPHEAFALLDKITREASKYLITWPIGYNKVLDKDLHLSGIPYKILERLDLDNNWAEAPVLKDQIFKYTYSSPYTCGNAIVLITNLEDLNAQA